MSLIDTLRDLEHLAPSHEPSSAELLTIVGKLIAYVEHGDALLAADDADRKARAAGEPALSVDDLLSPPPPDAPAAPSLTAPSAAAPASPAVVEVGTPVITAAQLEEKDAELAALRQQLATAQAQAERTQVQADTAATPEVP